MNTHISCLRKKLFNYILRVKVPWLTFLGICSTSVIRSTFLLLITSEKLCLLQGAKLEIEETVK